jgi:hypothetical protein
MLYYYFSRNNCTCISIYIFKLEDKTISDILFIRFPLINVTDMYATGSEGEIIYVST